ncbi:MAG: beta strand repeat-containing protein, partial [Prochlorotrichaceae cyanobacterium]
FDQFNVPSEHTANFQAPAPVDNVLGRVTGGSPSAIEGTVRVSGSDANLYLMNPAGIIFGEEARLDVPGSFNATSADGIGFEGGGEFSAEGRNQYHDLATSPNSFNFKGNNGDVVNHGNLAVPAGENLNLVGGTVESTGRLSAPGGGVNIIAVPGGDKVRIRQNGMVLELEVRGGEGLTATELPQRLTGGGDHANTLEIGEDGRVRLTNQPRGTATVRGTVAQPARIEADRLQVQGQAVLIENATIDSRGVIQQVILQGTQGSTAIVNSRINVGYSLLDRQSELRNVAGIGGLLEIMGRSVQVNQSQVNLRGSQKGQIRVEATSGNTEINHSQITIATPVLSRDQVSPLSAELNSEPGDLVLAGQLDILSPAQVVIARSDLAAYGIRIGGDFQGTGEFVTAQETIVEATSTIAAGNAWGTPLDGSGLPSDPQDPRDPFATAGRVIVWADDKTRFLGYLHNPAGFAEISGKRELDLGANWDQRINVGDLLLDPTNITITTGAGTFGDQTISNFLQNTGNLTITTAGGGTQAGDITVNGTAAINWTSANSLTLEADRSISFGNNSSITATGSGSIILEANQGVTPATGTFNGIDLTSSNVLISSNSGDITLSGKGGTVGGGGSNGIYLLSGSTIQTTSGTITLDGQGQASGFNNLGVRIEGSGTLVTAESGSITINGTGGDNNTAQNGIVIFNNAQVTSTGTGATASTIALNGTGGNATGQGFHQGIRIFNNARVSTVDGDMNLTGAGGNDPNAANQPGIYLNAALESTGAGNIILNGTGGQSSAEGYGVWVDTAGSVTATGSGTITIAGTGGSGNNTLSGILVSGDIEANTGNITLTGTGGTGTGGNNWGIGVTGGATIVSTGTGADAGTITLRGTAVSGTDNLRGVFVDNVGSLISSVDGAIDIEGTGGSGGAGNSGVVIRNGGIQATGLAPINIRGTGGTGTEQGTGVSILGGTLESVTGVINLDGQGGTANSSQGIALTNGAIVTTNSGKITFTGTGGTVGSDNVGISADDSEINTVDGNVVLTGIGGTATGENNSGIRFRASLITSTGIGTVTLTGTGSAQGSQFNNGILFRNVNAVTTPPTGIRSAIGDITLTGHGGSGPSWGIVVGEAADVLSTDTASIILTGTTVGSGSGIVTAGPAEVGGDSPTTGGDVSFFADTLTLSNATTLQGLGILTIAPATPGADFAVDFSIAPDSFAGITLGRLDTNITTVSGDTNLNAATTILGGAIDFSGSIISNDNDVTFQASRTILLNPGSSINTGAGNLSLLADQGAIPTIGAGIDLNGASLITTTGNITLNTLAAVLGQNNAQLFTGTGNITVTANTIALDSVSVQGLGILTLQPNDPAASIGIGDNVPGTFNLTATELNNIAPTFSTIEIGRTDGTGSVRVGINIDPTVALLVTIWGVAITITSGL